MLTWPLPKASGVTRSFFSCILILNVSEESVLTWNKCSRLGVFRTLSNIHDGPSLEQWLTDTPLTIFAKKVLHRCLTGS